MKFALDTKDFDSARADVQGQKTSLEIVKLDNTYYAIFEHNGDSADEVGCFTKAEMKTIWQILTTQK
jgi:hypothetical protein